MWPAEPKELPTPDLDCLKDKISFVGLPSAVKYKVTDDKVQEFRALT